MAIVGTLTRADLSDALQREVGLSRADSAKLVEEILDHMCDALARGENVKISGFGTFVLRDKGQRIGRNPKTGVEVPIAPRRVLVFRPSHVLKAMEVSDDLARSALRVSFGWNSAQADVDAVVASLVKLALRVRAREAA